MTAPILEHGTNFPRSLGRKTFPATKSRPLREGIANMGSAIGGVRDRTILPQASSLRGMGLLSGRARSKRAIRGKGLNISSDDNSDSGYALDRQLTHHPIIPLLDRIKPLIDSLKVRAPMISRRKVLGAFGLVGQAQGKSRRFALPGVMKNIPTPWKTREWSKTRNIANLPSVVGNILVSGPTKTMYGSGRRGLSVRA